MSLFNAKLVNKDFFGGQKSFYLEYPGGAHDQSEESRKVRSQDLHEHGDVVQNVSKKPGEE